jgi:hypothetical protein
MTSRSTSQKTLQSFHARTGLWNAFLGRAQEMDCSVDYLINEAMRMYASNHGFVDSAESATGQRAQTQKQQAKPPAPTVRARPGRGLPRPGGAQAPAAVPVPRPSQPPPPMRGPATLPRPGSGSAGSAARHAPAAPLPRPSMPPPLPRPGGDTGASGVARPPLMLVFQGRKIPVVQDQFIIGRGSKSSDLAIKDANISRKHAAVIFHNGAFYMKDLGSTNGVEYKGKPVDSKRIDEGDVFTICGHDIHFTYSG